MKENGAGGFQEMMSKAFKDCGCLILKIHGGLMQATGWPDMFISHKIWSGFLELKVDFNQPSALQEDRVRVLSRNGESAYVLRYLNTHDIVNIENADGKVLMTVQRKDAQNGRNMLNILAMTIDEDTDEPQAE